MSELQVVVFRLNDQLYGAEAFQVYQIIKYQVPVKVPKMPVYIEGMINYRDTVLPVIDLSRRFDVGKTEITKTTKIIVAKADNKFLGFVVNDVTEIIKLEESEIEEAPNVLKSTSGAYLKKIAKKGENLISIIDLYSVLDKNELEGLHDEMMEEQAL